MENVIDNKASKFLGQQINNYDLSYNPDLLVPIERSFNREAYNITDADFCGWDIWHNYECSFLVDNGYPLTWVGKIKIPSNSKYFIESKSLKLYFFSLNMKTFGEDIDSAIENYIKQVKKDLSDKIGMPVEFTLHGKLSGRKPFTFNFKNISKLVDVESMNFSNYKESPDLLERGGSGIVNIIFRNFRSNCRVTHQPDFSNLFLHLEGNLPDFGSLARYLVSFRNEYHFHEEVTEQIYKALISKFELKDIFIGNLFTRRGGLDICPIRSSSRAILDKQAITDCFTLTEPTIYQ